MLARRTRNLSLSSCSKTANGRAGSSARRACHFPLVGCQFSTTVIGRAGPASSGGVAMRNRCPSGVTS